MDRRAFLRGLLGGAAAVVAPERVYFFLKNNPFAPDPILFGINRTMFPARLSGIQLDIARAAEMMRRASPEPLTYIVSPAFYRQVERLIANG
jgi:hypothetical protein